MPQRGAAGAYACYGAQHARGASESHGAQPSRVLGGFAVPWKRGRGTLGHPVAVMIDVIEPDVLMFFFFFLINVRLAGIRVIALDHG